MAETGFDVPIGVVILVADGEGGADYMQRGAKGWRFHSKYDLSSYTPPDHAACRRPDQDSA